MANDLNDADSHDHDPAIPAPFCECGQVARRYVQRKAGPMQGENIYLCRVRNEFLEYRRLAHQLDQALECLPVEKRPINKHLIEAEKRWGKGVLNKDLRGYDPKDRAPGCDYFMYRQHWEKKQLEDRVRAEARKQKAAEKAAEKKAAEKKAAEKAAEKNKAPPTTHPGSQRNGSLWVKASTLPGGVYGPKEGRERGSGASGAPRPQTRCCHNRKPYDRPPSCVQEHLRQQPLVNDPQAWSTQAQPSYSEDDMMGFWEGIDVIEDMSDDDVQVIDPPKAGPSRPANPAMVEDPIVRNRTHRDDQDADDEILDWNEWFDRAMQRIHDEFNARANQKGFPEGKGKGWA
ncbi:hypothetical protein CALVIDRAFT_526159 [Calocera viscosa TUFC12733]|uniref:Uncharacterized protein n=1 Tax=Calocera viscosa (strain TUFC12733) TaxID=1330018 RepID=A0A167P0D7_CALVF|nr:hypothetical protein CALVIDRAFT_526159 [Calocera viscosa TUFC12733]